MNAFAHPSPSLGDCVCTWRPHRRPQHLDPLSGKDRVERGGELRVSVTKQEPELLDAACEIHEQAAGLLGHPRPGWVGGHSEDVHPAGGTLDHEQHVQAPQQHRIDVEEVGRQDPLGLRGQELPPGQPGTARRWLDARSFEKQPHRARRDRVPKPAEFTVEAVLRLVGSRVLEW